MLLRGAFELALLEGHGGLGVGILPNYIIFALAIWLLVLIIWILGQHPDSTERQNAVKYYLGVWQLAGDHGVPELVLQQIRLGHRGKVILIQKILFL